MAGQKLHEVFGELMTIEEAAKKHGLSVSTINSRRSRNGGISVEAAIRKGKPNKKGAWKSMSRFS